MRKTTAESFWNRVRVLSSEQCWEWTGSKNNTGYGTVSWNGKVYTAHRVAAWLTGVVSSLTKPKNAKDTGHVLHKCDNRACCNPSHFFLGSYADNQRDAYQKKRRVALRGSRHPNARLSPEQVEAIRHAYATKQQTQMQLASTYNVSQRCVSLIVRGETYK